MWKRWFITEENEAHYVQSYLRKNIVQDYKLVHCIVESYTDSDLPSTYQYEVVEVESKNFFNSRKKAEMEIIRRERFKTDC